MNRYIIGFLAAVGLIVLVIILIVRALVSSPSTPKGVSDLASLVGTGSSVQFTIDSPVTAAVNHYDAIINVSNYQATMTVTQGYEGQVLRTQSYPTGTSAYAIFLRALKYNGFTQGNNDPSVKDERGQCALGTRYIYQVTDSSGNDLQRYWYSTCHQGTFQGNASAVQRLFQLQIPDYNKLVSGITL